MKVEQSQVTKLVITNVNNHDPRKVIICGYDYDLYNGQLSSWRKAVKTTAANGHAGSVKRTECLWLNF